MKKSLLLTTLLFILFGTSAWAQKGTLSGTIIDGENGDELVGAHIYIPELTGGTASDVSGKYRLELDPGVYTVEYSFITYQKQVIRDIEIESGRVTEIDIILIPAGEELEEVVVSARRIDNNEASLLRLQKKSLSVQDGISSQEIGRIGFSNSAESMRQVTGASVEDGKYIVMRGLGDRYSISSMDGAVLPTTNPYRNSASLDLIPASMVDNIVVKKTFSPDLPGNFTGGAVDINTKSLPDRLYLRLNTSMSYNDQTTLNNNFLGDPVKNSLGRLGYDDGSRAREKSWAGNEYLTHLNKYMVRIQNNDMQDQEVEEFNKTMRSFSTRPFGVRKKNPGFDHSFNATIGNRHRVNGGQVGYNFGLNYNKSYTQYDEREINNYKSRIPDGSTDRMQAFQLNRGTESRDEVNNGFIGSLTWQWNTRNELSFMSIYNNNATESVLDMSEGFYPGALSAGSYNNRVISFIQRELLNNQLKGEHYMGQLDLKWSANYIHSSQYEPNTRFIGSPVDSSGKYFFVREVQLPFHFFRDLADVQYNAKVDGEYKISNHLSFKSGVFYSRKDRDFQEFRYQLENNGTDPDAPGYLSFREASGDFENFFAPENTGILTRDTNGDYVLGLTYRDQTRPENSYTGFEQITAFYMMGVFNFSEELRIFGGARAEKTDFSVVSSAVHAEEGSIDVMDILPSVNLIYAPHETGNLRFSVSRTLARPNMREMAPFVSFDLLGGFPIVGNQDLVRTNITNLDARYEIFPAAGELLAWSVFYKSFTNPIVLELDVSTDQPQYHYKNTSKGRLYGFEIELRKRLGFISRYLDNFKISTNFSYINSRVDMSEREFETRKKLDPSIKPYRPFPYQSPYLINLSMIYESEKSGWQGAVYANISGPRLTANGSGAAPDIFEIYGKPASGNNRLKKNLPTPDLNVRIGKSFFNGFSASVTVNNLLDYSVIQYQKADDTFYTNNAYNPGRSLKLSFTYEIN